MRRLIIILLLSGASLLHGQHLNFIQVDTLTYNQYLRADWKGLIKSGKAALDNEINYYYLQMRIAYAYFSMEKYRQSASYYKNALKFNSSDPIAFEYLYYSYKYAGRDNDALAIVSSLTDQQQQAMGINIKSKLVSFGLGYASSFSNASELQNDIIDGTTIRVDGVQKASIGLNAPGIQLSHRIGKRVIIRHQASMLFKDEMSLAIVNGIDYFSPEQPIRQFEYGMDAGILVAGGFLVNPGVGFITTGIPLYSETSYGISAGRNRDPLGEVRLQNWIEKIVLEKQMTFFDIGLSYVHHNFNFTSTNQFGFHTTVYPMANLNLYFSLDAYGQLINSNETSATGIIAKPLLGFRVFKNLWLEFSGTFPEHFNFYDVRNSVAHNNIEKTASALEVLAIVPLYSKNLKLFLGYQYRTMNSYFFPVDNILEPGNKLMYNSHLITGGIKWTK